MKKTILILFLFAATATFAQGNLQINQVLLLNSTSASDLNLGTVPADKIWKVESFGGSGAMVTGTLNGQAAGNLIARYSHTHLANNSWTLPVWLPAGTQLGFTANIDGNMVWFSIIEFNIVP